MSIIDRISRLANRHLPFLFTVVVLASLCAGVSAQTVASPQLLPYTVTVVAGGGTYGSSYAGYYNNGTNTSCSYQAWSSSQSKYVATVDSNHTPTDTVGDGCLATEASLSSTVSAPATTRSAAADSEGNVFFIDSVNNLIRRVDAHTGVVTTVAGFTVPSTSQTAPTFTGIASQATCPNSKYAQQDAYGDGCLATEVPMASPQALALDPQGNIWFTDYELGAVREIVKSTGVIQTVVNQSVSVNPGITSNGFTWGKGTGYVGYNANNVTNNPATSSSYVTAAKALLFRPYGLGFDEAGNLYVADNYNNLVDVVNLSNATRTIAGYTVYAGEVFTIAGTGCPARWDTYTAAQTVSSTTTPSQANMSCDSSAYYGHSNGNSPYPSTGSTIDSPYQVSADNSGNIYIADEYPYDVRVIAGSTGYTLPSGTSLGLGDIGAFAGVPNSSRTATAAVVRGVATSTKLGSVYGVTADSSGNVYIADYDPDTNYLERVDIASGELYPIAGQVSTAAPTTAGIAPTGAVYCSSPSSATSYLTGYSDDIGDGCPALKATFWKPYFPSIDAAGNLYIGDAGNGLIRKLSSGTQFPASAVAMPVTQSIAVHFGVGDTPATAAPYALPSGSTEFALGTPSCTLNSDTTTDCVLPVTFTPAKAGVRTAPLTVTSKLAHVSTFALTGTGLAPLLAVDPGTQSTLASTGVTAVSGIALDDAGNVYAAVPSSSSIVAISSTGTSKIGTSLTGANAVAIDGSGNIYAALVSGSVVEVPSNGGSQIAIGSGFTDPAGIAVDARGNVYVADEAASSVSEILAGTGVQVVLANSSTVSGLDEPTGVAVDSYGNVFVSSTVANTVIELPFNGSAAVTLGSGLDAPIGLAVDPAGSLYVADSKNSRIVFIPNENGALTTGDQLAIITGLGTPTGVAVAGNGTVYVADSYANAVCTFTRNQATINLGNALTAIGSQSAATNTAAADIISMGTQPATFGTSFATASGSNPGDFGLSPSSIPVSSYFPDAGFGVSLTASFTPGALGARSATFTFDATDVSQPTLALSGAGIQPHDTTTTTVTTILPSGQTNWIYGQTVTVNLTVSVNSGLPAPMGTVSVYVDGNGTAAGTPSLTAGTASSTASLLVPGLSAGPHSITVSYGGDTESSASNGSLNLTVNQAPLIVTGETVSKPFDAPLPTLTGTLAGTVNGDVIGVSYSTTAVFDSPVVAAGYPITPLVSGSALGNYAVTINNGTLFVTKDNTVNALSTSATSVNSTTQVTLTATVSNQTAYAGGTAPTGYVAFYNTVNSVQTQIGANAQLNSSGVATIVTTFAVVGATTNNSVTAVYLGDTNFVGSNSASIAIVSGAPTFALAQSANTSLTIMPGQSGLTSFTVTPAFGYNGNITFSCTGLPATVTCTFSPASIVANGSGTPSVVTITFNTQQPQSPLSFNRRPTGIPGSGGVPLALAAIPGLALLCGFSRRRRKLFRGYGSLMLVFLCLLGIGLCSCGGSVSIAGTPAGTDTVTVVASGMGGSFASVTQQFTVTLNVQ